jgi:hypothetical protein
VIPELEEKDKSIQMLVEYLIDIYGLDKFKIKDNWKGDRCAIGLGDLTERYLIYISTYRMGERGYDVFLENPAKHNSNLPYEPSGNYVNVKREEVIQLFVKHLRIEI